MRDLERNKQPFWYALLDGETQIYDGRYRTGERKLTYTTPVKMFANISPANGIALEDVFGKDLQYDRSIVTCDMTCPITETSVLWIGIEPTSNGQAVPYNYIVTRIAKGLNNIVYAVKKVEMR